MQMASVQQEPYLGTECENCKFGKYDIPLSGQEWHLVCDECGTVKMVYEPLPHQEAFHADPHKYKMFAGGYGSGKTTTACMEAIDHIVSTPGGTTLIGADTLPQLEQTAMKEFFEVFPAEWITHYNKQKNYLDTMNGHRVIFRPLDSEQKARSLNLTFFWIEEANGVAYSYFTQLKTRLRNKATENHRGILSTNPDMGWVKTEILLKADKIFNSEREYNQNLEEIDRNISVHIAPTHLNIHLPDTYYEDTANGMPDWWINRFLHGSFENKEGLVYPMYEDCIVDDFEIPTHWKRRFGGDFGLNNPTAFAYLATDPADGTVYLYKEHKKSHETVEYHANVLLKELKKLPYGVIDDLVGDAAGQQKTAGDPQSVFDHYAEYGVYWNPSTKRLDDSIMKLYTYMRKGRFKIFRSCHEAIDEFSSYKYPERSLDKEIKDEDHFEKPIAVNDHLADAIRYGIADLPDNPDLLINKSYNAQFVIQNTRMISTTLPPELQEDEDVYSYSRSDAWRAY